MKEELQIYETPKKSFYIGFFIQLALYIAWFVYIYGILGHVCPVAYLGVWNLSLIGCVAFGNRRPRFLGTIVTLILTAAAWGLSFFYLHPNDGSGWEVEDPTRIITIGPILVFAICIPLMILIQIGFTRFDGLQGEEKVSANWEISLERLLAGFSFLGSIVFGFGYTTLPFVRESVWDDSASDLFDTVFQAGDIYWLFFFIAVISAISGIFMGISAYAKSKKIRNLEFISHILGYTLFGFVGMGTWGTFVYLGKPKTTGERE